MTKNFFFPLRRKGLGSLERNLFKLRILVDFFRKSLTTLCVQWIIMATYFINQFLCNRLGLKHLCDGLGIERDEVLSGGRGPLLHGPQLGVDTALLVTQLLVGADLHDSATVHGHDLVGVFDGGETVRDDKNRSVAT